MFVEQHGLLVDQILIPKRLQVMEDSVKYYWLEVQGLFLVPLEVVSQVNFVDVRENVYEVGNEVVLGLNWVLLYF